MLADYINKPLQGSLFIRLRHHIMGAEFEDGNPKTHRSVLGDEDDYENKEASERDQQPSKRDQNEILARDQNHENACEVSAMRDQNNKDVREGNTHFGKTKEKQMTYREALLGLDNSELSSVFKIYSVCETLRKRIRSV